MILSWISRGLTVSIILETETKDGANRLQKKDPLSTSHQLSNRQDRRPTWVSDTLCTWISVETDSFSTSNWAMNLTTAKEQAIARRRLPNSRKMLFLRIDSWDFSTDGMYQVLWSPIAN